ncbi:MAG: hypothetical protein OJF48_001913 [Afipia sp.]|jgi:hypothetical protein|nr:MAG: hypothetical protein OJF48_001913 [Afipia sp.]
MMRAPPIRSKLQIRENLQAVHEARAIIGYSCCEQALSKHPERHGSCRSGASPGRLAAKPVELVNIDRR